MQWDNLLPVPISKIIGTVLLAGLACCSNRQITRSSGLTLPARIHELGKAIKLRSEVLDTEFLLFDVNRSGSIPGASSKDYKIFIRLRPADVPLWTAGKDTWITSFPKDHSWVREIVLDSSLAAFEKAGYTTYFKAENGYEYTLWASEKSGILLLRFLQN